MPIYEYGVEPDSPTGGCDHCRERFEVIQAISEEPLTSCPQCGEPVRRLFSSFRGKVNIVQPANLARQGFTQYVKRGDGYYEKAFGKGPETLHRD